jgi:hypothetical protein
MNQSGRGGQERDAAVEFSDAVALLPVGANWEQPLVDLFAYESKVPEVVTRSSCVMKHE